MKVKIVNHSPYPCPSYATAYSAGVDLKANIPESIVLKPLQRALVPTGMYVAIPEGHEIQIRPRSGLALKKSITVLNTPGTIDAGYRGEVCVILINHGTEPFVISRGDRIAQMVIQELPEVSLELVKELPSSERGAGGFGSTGK